MPALDDAQKTQVTAAWQPFLQQAGNITALNADEVFTRFNTWLTAQAVATPPNPVAQPVLALIASSREGVVQHVGTLPRQAAPVQPNPAAKPGGIMGFLSNIGTWGWILGIGAAIVSIISGLGPLVAAIAGIAILGVSGLVGGNSEQQRQSGGGQGAPRPPLGQVMVLQPRSMDGVNITHGVEIGSETARRTLLGRMEGNNFIPSHEIVTGPNNQMLPRRLVNPQPMLVTNGYVDTAIPAWLQAQPTGEPVRPNEMPSVPPPQPPQQVTQAHPVTNIQPGGPGPQPQGPPVANVVAPILSRLTAPAGSVQTVVNDRLALLRSVNGLRNAQEWENARRNLTTSETQVLQFFSNVNQYLTVDREQYHAPNGERAGLVAIAGDWSQRSGTRLTPRLANAFVPTLPGVDSIGLTVETGGTSYTPAQVMEHYRNGTGPWTIGTELADYGRTRYLAHGTGLSATPGGARLNWEQLSPQQKIYFMQQQLIEDCNLMQNGTCRQLPAHLAGGTARAIDINSINTTANAVQVSTIRRKIRNNEDYGNWQVGGLQSFFSSYVKAAMEEGRWDIVESAAGQARTRYANGSPRFGLGKDATLAATFGDIETYAKAMQVLQARQHELYHYMQNRQQPVYELYQNLGADHIGPARRAAMQFLHQRMPILQQSGVAIFGVKRCSGNTQCPAGINEGIAITYVDTRRPGNTVSTAFGTIRDGNFVITHSFAGVMDFENAEQAITAFNNSRLTTPVSINAGAINQLLPPAGTQDPAPLADVAGRSVAAHLGDAFRDMPVRLGTAWVTPTNVRQVTHAEFVDWVAEDPPIPAGLLPPGVTRDDCTGISFVRPGRNITSGRMFGYIHNNKFIITHSWEGRWDDLRPGAAAWNARKLETPIELNMNGNSIQIPGTLWRDVPIFTNGAWQRPEAAKNNISLGGEPQREEIETATITRRQPAVAPMLQAVQQAVASLRNLNIQAGAVNDNQAPPVPFPVGVMPQAVQAVA